MLFGRSKNKKENEAEKIGDIVSFENITVDETGMRFSLRYEIVCRDGEAVLMLYEKRFSAGESELVPQASVKRTAEEIVALMNNCGVPGWNGFHGAHPKDVSDGIMFDFNAVVNGGVRIRADGSENFPQGYREFIKTITAMLREVNG